MEKLPKRLYLTEIEEKQINIRFHTRNDSNSAVNCFLNRVMRKIRSNRKPIALDTVYTLFNAGHYYQLWIQTPACKYSQIGQCTVCNYWEGNIQAGVIDKVVSECSLPENCETLLVNTCGSCMDSYEVLFDEQKKLFEWIEHQTCRKVILETHLNTLNRESIRRVREIICSKELYFEVGVESLSKEILFYSLNKVIPIDALEDIVSCIHSVGAFCIANVLLGAPFMTQEEQIGDVINSIRLLFEKFVDYVVIFPVNIKPNTLLSELNKVGGYTVVNGNMIIKILSEIPKELLGRIDIAWYGEHVEDDVIAPTICPDCQPELISLISEYNKTLGNEDRTTIVRKMANMVCRCARNNQIQNDTKSFYKRICEGYDLTRHLVLEDEL